jgi:hypothetical protein
MKSICYLSMIRSERHRRETTLSLGNRVAKYQRSPATCISQIYNVHLANVIIFTDNALSLNESFWPISQSSIMYSIPRGIQPFQQNKTNIFDQLYLTWKLVWFLSTITKTDSDKLLIFTDILFFWCFVNCVFTYLRLCYHTMSQHTLALRWLNIHIRSPFMSYYVINLSILLRYIF